MRSGIKEVLLSHPELKKDLFIRGFLITDKEISTDEFPFYGNWRTERHSGYYFMAHEKAGMHILDKGNKTFFIMGHAYNPFTMEIDGLKILNLSSNEYTILHWLALLLDNRRFRLSTPVMRRGTEWLKEHFLIDISEFDLIIGYRADDSYFSFARAFVSNEISLSQLNYAMRLGKLGEQYVLKSEKAFRQIKFKDSELADNTIYYARRKKRDDDARNAFFEQLEKEDIEGIYMRDIIREEMTSDDARLR